MKNLDNFQRSVAKIKCIGSSSPVLGTKGMSEITLKNMFKEMGSVLHVLRASKPSCSRSRILALCPTRGVPFGAGTPTCTGFSLDFNLIFQ